MNGKARPLDGSAPDGRGTATVPLAGLPTPVALAARRVNSVGIDGEANTFLLLSSLAEAAIKLLGVSVYGACDPKHPEIAYRWGHSFVRDPGLGSWDRATAEAIGAEDPRLLPRSAQELSVWGTRKRKPKADPWFFEAKEAAAAISRELGVSGCPDPSSARGLVSLLVFLRNKTKGHGSPGPEFFRRSNERYLKVVLALLESCPVYRWEWVGHTSLGSEKSRAVLLAGNDPLPLEGPLEFRGPPRTGISFRTSPEAPLFEVDALLSSDQEYRSFLFPNGGMNATGSAELIDYGRGQTTRSESTTFAGPPVPLPESETQGLPGLDIQGNLFGNLPVMPAAYVRRLRLENELREMLVELPYNVLTLHGRGGVGKTRLALHVVHELAALERPPFDHVVWFSARDVDLTPTGPKAVQPAMDDLESAAETYGRVFGLPGSVESFRAGLNAETEQSRKTLFIFDNFETIADKHGFQKFLADNTRPPNRLLITSRERDFYGDRPLEVSGMDWEEARELLCGVGASLGIEALLSEEVMRKIFDTTEGHAYVMRLVAGEIAARGDATAISQVMTQRDRVLDAVFERSYSRLSEAGKTTFLTVGNWKAAIPEISLIATLGKRGFDVLDALEECVRLALIERGPLKDGEPCYWAPQLARIFAHRKLTGATDALTIRGDLEELRKFGVISISGPKPGYREIMSDYARYCLSQARDASPELRESLGGMLERSAEHWPEAWLALVDFRNQSGASQELVLETTQRAVEAMPANMKAWKQRLRQARAVNDEEVEVTAMIELAALEPADHVQLEASAAAVIKYVTDHKAQIPIDRRESYVRSVREHMSRQADRLTPSALQRLAWLYLIEGDDETAWSYAEMGVRRNPRHKGCLALLERIEEGGYRPGPEHRVKTLGGPQSVETRRF